MSDSSSRRTFMGASGAALSALWTARAAPGPNDTINLGIIGCGARGRGLHIPTFSKLGGRFVAVCDLNEKYLAEARKRAGGEGVAAYHDYRKLLEDKNVDAVIIATNQQWHVLPAVTACQAGKDVYLEKPMGNSAGEGRFVIQAAQKYKRIVQIGTQQRSQEHYRRAVEVVQSGKLGDISEVDVWDYVNQAPGFGSPPDCDPPAELDWNFYVGPSPFRRYNPNIYFKYGYDWFKVSGAGHQVAWGVHHFDIVLWAMGVKSATTISAQGGNYGFQDNREWPNTFSATAQFGPGPVAKNGFLLRYTMRAACERETRAHGKCFYGTQASMLLDRAGYSITTEPRTKPPVPVEEVKALPDDVLHYAAFLENVRARKQPNANPETGHHASALGHLMNVSWEAGRTIRWDGEKEHVIGDRDADKLVLKPYRAPWKLSV